MFRAFVLASAVLAAVPAAASAQSDDPWRRVVTGHVTAQDLGLTGEPAAGRLAEAAVRRNAAALGLRASQPLGLAAESGDARLRTLRFQQSVRRPAACSGARSTSPSTDDAVTSISATTVPFPSAARGPASGGVARAAAGDRRARPARLGDALPAQPVAYAGRPRKPRRRGAPGWCSCSPSRTPADQPDDLRGRRRRHRQGADALRGLRSGQRGSPRTARRRGRRSLCRDLRRRRRNRRRRRDPPAGTASRCRAYSDRACRATPSSATALARRPIMAAVLVDACHQARVLHRPRSSTTGPSASRRFIANSGHPIGSHYSSPPARHHARDRAMSTTTTSSRTRSAIAGLHVGRSPRRRRHQQADEVQEALADMFASTSTTTRACSRTSVDFPGDKLKTGSRRYLGSPAPTRATARRPDTMRQYRCAADTDQHINATILGHAYYWFVARRRLAAHRRGPGDVLTYVPFALRRPRRSTRSRSGSGSARTSSTALGSADAAIRRLPRPRRHRRAEPAGKGCAAPSLRRRPRRRSARRSSRRRRSA